MNVREVKLSDTSNVLSLMHCLDNETTFMLFEPNERKTTLAEQAKIIESFLQSNHKTMFVLSGDYNFVTEDYNYAPDDGNHTLDECSSMNQTKDMSPHIYGFVAGGGSSFRRNKHIVNCVIGIKQEVAGNGYGGRLLAHFEQWAKTQHKTRIELTVLCHNERAIKLYQSCGFEIEGTKRKALLIDGEYVDEYFMAKLI